MFNPEHFDIISFFIREGGEGEIGVHAFKMPYSCEQFFIPLEMFQSPTFWQDLHELALKKWQDKGATTAPTCARCGKNNHLRWYEGRAFCSWCGLPYPDAVDDHRRRIGLKP